jgi:large subunit ribosomal protein L9
MKVFFIKTMDGIGTAGELKVVSDGYARNFLLPNGSVLEYTAANKKNIENLLNKKEETVVKIEKKRSILSDAIEGIKLIFAVKMHDDGRLYGSIGSVEIVDELQKKNISVSKNQILLEKPLKKIGTYSIKIKLSASLQPELKVRVMAEQKI